MKRALSSCWTLLLAVVWIGLTGTAAYAGKPTIAILGLEVVDASGQIDQASTGVARDLTEGLRSRAKVGSGPFQLQPGSDKELIDEKLIKNCDNEAIPCMSQIGKDLGADYLMYGQLKKATDGYVVTLNLLNVGKKKFEKAKAPLLIPFDKKDPQSLQEMSRKAYNDLSGVSEAGTLVIKATPSTGTVFVDDSPKAQLAGGTATISQLPEGRYRVAIEAEGFKRSEETVITIRSGETVTQDVTMVKVDREFTGTTSGGEGGGRGVWKGAFAVSTVVTAASGALWIYGWNKIPLQDDLNASGAPVGFSHKDCKDRPSFGAGDDTINAACEGYNYSTYGIIGVSVGGVAMAFTGYMAFMRSGGEAKPVGMSTAGRRSKKKELAITPILSPDGGGATFRLDW